MSKYRVGDWFRVYDSEGRFSGLNVLLQTRANEYALFSISSGNRWNNPKKASVSVHTVLQSRMMKLDVEVDKEREAVQFVNSLAVGCRLEKLGFRFQLIPS
jgi:hypothetical protein